MVYMVLFNRKYGRQFEAVVSREEWNDLVYQYGAAWAAAILIMGVHRVKSKKKKTAKREESYRHFILGNLNRPDIFGAPLIKIGKSKKAILEKGRRGHSEFLVTTRAGEVEAAPRFGFRRGLGKVYEYQMSKQKRKRSLLPR